MLKYDFIILGSGAAGLSLLARMIDSPHFANKKILLIDKEPKVKNDRTWCYWENQNGFFEEVVYRTWDELLFFSEEFSGNLSITPYQYKMIRGIDFYNYCFARINQSPNIDIMYGEIRSVVNDQKRVTICLDDNELIFDQGIVFNSIYRPSAPVHGELQLLQHFKGWIIESMDAGFNLTQATLMDFRVHQGFGTSFIYVLPISNTRALVEYTLFTPKTLENEQYNNELRHYIKHFLKLKDFSITEEEFGIIPMTNSRFRFFENNMYNIGIAGGQTKASTGYTFQFIQKQSTHIIDCLVHNKPLTSIPGTLKRFLFYDSVLLQLLISKTLGGKEIFTRMFERNKASKIFKFLDNDTSVIEELQLISTLQTAPFLQAALRVLSH